MMKKKLFVIIFILFTGISIGQINEAGVFLGGSNYIGDIGRTNWIYPNSFAVGAVYKWNMHPRYSIRANYTYSKIIGDDAQSNNSFRKYRDLNFSNSIHELVVGIEFHFFKYSLSKIGYTNTPYILLEAGVVNYSTFAGGVSPATDRGRRLRGGRRDRYARHPGGRGRVPGGDRFG